MSGMPPARAAAANVAAVDAALSAYENSQAHAAALTRPVLIPVGRASAESMPQWKSSLSDIQETSASLLETNARLTAEENQLKGSFDDLTARTEALAGKNEQQAAELARVEKAGGTEDMLRIKDVLTDRVRALREQRTAQGAVQIRQKSLENKLALARLRMAELGIDRKSAELDRKVREDAVLAGVRAEKVKIRASISKVREQTGLLREKTLELRRVDDRDLPKLREITGQNAVLKDRLGVVQAGDDEVQAKLSALLAKRTKLETDRNYLHIKELLPRREALAGQLQDNSLRLVALRKESTADEQNSTSALAADIEKLDRQNVAMDQEIGDLRENIALLEYKVNTLQRYKDRNKPGR